MKNKLYALILIIVALPCIAQDYTLVEIKGFRKYKKAITTADTFYKKRDYNTSSVYYKYASNRKKKNYYPAFWAGESLRKARNYKEAEVYFRRASKVKNLKRNDISLYRLAEMMKINGNIDSASVRFERFMRAYEVGEEDEYFFLAENQMKGCQLVYKSHANQGFFTVTNVGSSINSNGNDFGAVNFDNETIYYNSFAKSSGLQRIFESTKDENGTFKKGTLISKRINTRSYNVGYPAFNLSRTEMFFSRCYENDSLPNCNIYRSVIEDNQWSEPVSVSNFINSDYSKNIQPSLAESAKGQEVLFFSSDRKNGKGRMDIWYSIRLNDGTFSIPRNAGIINSPGNEVTPFYNNRFGLLFFSSDYFHGFGGFDVFKASGNKDSWRDMENVGSPINSSADDYYFSISEDLQHGFVSSNREGGFSDDFPTSNDDIYEVFQDSSNMYADVRFRVIDKDTKEYLEGAEVVIYAMDKVTKEKILVSKGYTDPVYASELKRLRQYLIEVNFENYYYRQFYYGPIFKSNQKEMVVDLIITKK